MRQSGNEEINFGDCPAMRLKQARIAAGYTTCAALGRAVYNNGMAPTGEGKVISAIENGTRTLTEASAEKYAPVLNVSPEWLMCLTDAKNAECIDLSRIHFIETTVSAYVSTFFTMCGLKSVWSADDPDLCGTTPKDVLDSFAYAIYEKHTLDLHGQVPADNSCWGNIARQQFLAEIVFTDNNLKKDGYVELIQGSVLIEKLYYSYYTMRAIAHDTHAWLKQNGARQYSESYNPSDNYGSIYRLRGETPA